MATKLETTNNEINSQTKVKKPKEQFMALRKNVWIKLRELRGDLKPNEYFLLEDICDGTVDWRRKFTDFNLETLAENLGVGLNKVYAMLKVLEKKKLILRVKIPQTSCRQSIGLNPEIFGQILINKHEKTDKSHLKRHLTCVVNNPAPILSTRDPDLSTTPEIVVPFKYQSGTERVPDCSQIGTTLGPKEDQNGLQTSETIEEFRPSRLLSQTFFPNNSSKSETEGNFNKFPREKTEADYEETRRKLRLQTELIARGAV